MGFIETERVSKLLTFFQSFMLVGICGNVQYNV